MHRNHENSLVDTSGYLLDRFSVTLSSLRLNLNEASRRLNSNH